MKFKTTTKSVKDLKRKWYIVDATNTILGRLATRVATVLMGKHKPDYSTHLDNGDNVIITNCSRIKLTGKKRNSMRYDSYSLYMSGYKSVPFERAFKEDPTFVVREAVRRMLPKTNRGRLMLKKLKLYSGDKHPHKAQNPVELKLKDIRNGRVRIDD